MIDIAWYWQKNISLSNSFNWNSRIPSSVEIRNGWLEKVAEHQEVVYNVVKCFSLCNLHFSPNSFTGEGGLLSNAIPTIFPIRNLWVNFVWIQKKFSIFWDTDSFVIVCNNKYSFIADQRRLLMKGSALITFVQHKMPLSNNCREF